MSADVKFELDPLPTNLLKKVLKCVLPLITSTINKSVSESDVPAYFKKAHDRPLKKKPNMDKEVKENYQLVSDLHFYRRSGCYTLESPLSTHKLQDDLLSGYRGDHCTETALLKVHQIRHAWQHWSCSIYPLLLTSLITGILTWSERKCPILDHIHTECQIAACHSRKEYIRRYKSGFLEYYKDLSWDHVSSLWYQLVRYVANMICFTAVMQMIPRCV